MQTIHDHSLIAQVEKWIAPLDLYEFYHLLINNGFDEQGYYLNHPHLQPLANTPLAFFLHFANEGILNRLYFQPKNVNRDFLTILNELYQTFIENKFYKLALVANFACSFMNERLFHDRAVTGATAREAADLFSNADIQTLLMCKAFGALPYFVMGDSHSRLYQHHGLLSDNGWLLPIAMTCRGGSARGLANTHSRFKYGNRLQLFFQRIQPVIEQGIKCFFKFGQVDIEYLFNFKWSQEGYQKFDEEKFVTYTDTSIQRYIEFLSQLVPPHLRQHTFVCSVSLPVLADSICKKIYLEGIFAFNPESQREIEKLCPTFYQMEVPNLQGRSQLHLNFNQRLQHKAAELGFPFANDAILFIDEKTQVVKEIYTTQSAGLDVHLDRTEPTLLLINQFINELLTGKTYA